MSQLLKLNSFMITENQKYGINLEELQKINEALEKEEEKNREIQKSMESNLGNSHSGHYDLSFLYKRESDKIGQGMDVGISPCQGTTKKTGGKEKKATFS